MKHDKINRTFDLKYIIRETLLIFIGISLAIWFNNWNTTNTDSINKKNAIGQIKKEIKENKNELVKVSNKNQKIIDAWLDYEVIFEENSRSPITNPTHLNLLKKKHPDFFRVKDSIKLKKNTFKYVGGFNFSFTSAEFSGIAWKTAQLSSITINLDFECLYKIESLYSLQDLVKKILNKAYEALLESNMNDFKKQMNVFIQLSNSLEESYIRILKEIDSCL